MGVVVQAARFAARRGPAISASGWALSLDSRGLQKQRAVDLQAQRRGCEGAGARRKRHHRQWRPDPGVHDGVSMAPLHQHVRSYFKSNFSVLSVALIPHCGQDNRPALICRM